MVERSIRHSLCFAILPADALAGFARVISDRATFAYLGDVFVLPAHRGKGVARAMLEALHGHPELQGLRRWLLFTLDMQPVYEKLGWTPIPHPERVMERHFPDIYQR